MSDINPKRPSQVTFSLEPRSLFSDFFRIDEYQISFQKFDLSMSAPQRLLVFDRGQAVAALLYDKVQRKVIFVDQFRLPTYHGTRGADHRGSGWIYECAAGMIKEGESAYQALVREVKEETGYAIKEPIQIASFYSSPGGSTEMIHLYLAEVSPLDKKGPGRGIEEEDIANIEIDVHEFFTRLDAREFTDPKLILAGYFLKDHLARSKRQIPSERAQDSRWKIKGSNNLVLGIRPGDMRNWKDIDVWVNSENTDMEMDQFFGRGVSATIRHSGAVKHDGTKRVKIDTIAEELRSKRGRQGFVAPGTVIETGPGELARTHNVKRILHVAVVEGAFGTGLTFDEGVLEKSVNNVLWWIDEANKKLAVDSHLKSVLMPMLGSGNAEAPLATVAPRIVDLSVKFLEERMKREASSTAAVGGLRAIYLSAFDDRAEYMLSRVLSEDPRLEKLGA